MSTSQRHERVVYYDLLRIIAALAVMLGHISASGLFSVDVHSSEWSVFNISHSIIRWSVPVFTMISGALFLDNTPSIEKMYKKYILRIVTAFCFWSAVNVLFSVFQSTPGQTSIKTAFKEFLRGHYHMWFLYMIVGLYMITPLLKKVIENEEYEEYFLLLALLFAFIIPQLVSIISVFRVNFDDFVNVIIDYIGMKFVLGYSFYYVLGHYVSKKNISRNAFLIIATIGAIGFLMTIVLTQWISARSNAVNEMFYESFTFNVLFEALFVFVAFKKTFENRHFSEKTYIIICKLSKYTFGAYLVHTLIIEQLYHMFDLHPLSFNPILAEIAILGIVFCVSFLISAIINRIPFLRKYIV